MKYGFVLLALSPISAFAQGAGDVDDHDDRRWTVGLGAAVLDSPYAGEGVRTTPYPAVSFEGERWFVRGFQGGVHLLGAGGLQVDAMLAGRFEGFDVKDLSRKELMRNGINADLLTDRKYGLDAGLGLSWTGSFGQVRVNALSDISGTSDGFEAAIDYSYFIQAGSWTFTPSVGGRWMSKDLTHYYYGTLEKEAARGVVVYKPGEAFVPTASFGIARTFADRWTAYGGVEYKFLPSGITESPLVKKNADGVATFAAGFSYRF